MTRKEDSQRCIENAKEKVNRCGRVGRWFGETIVAGLASKGSGEAG